MENIQNKVDSLSFAANLAKYIKVRTVICFAVGVAVELVFNLI